MIELTLPSPEKSRKKGAKVAEKRKSETYVKKTEKTVDETEINFNPKPKPKTTQKKKDKKVIYLKSVISTDSKFRSFIKPKTLQSRIRFNWWMTLAKSTKTLLSIWWRCLKSSQ